MVKKDLLLTREYKVTARLRKKRARIRDGKKVFLSSALINNSFNLFKIVEKNINQIREIIKKLLRTVVTFS